MTPALDAEIRARMQAVVRALVRGSHGVVSQRARRYRAHPMSMIGVDVRLPGAGPHEMMRIGRHLLANASRTRTTIQLVPVTLINARAVCLLARWERRFGERVREAA